MYLSVHIPKTTGASIRNTLRERFGSGFFLHYWQFTSAAGEVLTDVPSTAGCVHGHFRADALAARFPRARLITWVRDPADRVISTYYHRLREPDWENPRGLDLRTGELSLLEFAGLPQVRNEMSRFFGRKRPADFAFIGVVERFDRSYSRLRSMLGLPPGPAVANSAQPFEGVPRFLVTAEERAAIEKLNASDLELYLECLARDDREAETAGENAAWIDPVRIATGS